MTAQKGFTPIVVLVFAVLLVIIILVISFLVLFKKNESPTNPSATQNVITQPTPSASPSPKTTSDSAWLKYEDKQKGFQLEYPAKYVNIPRDKEDKTTAFDVTNKPNPERGLYAVPEDMSYYEITVYIKPANETLEEIGKGFDIYNNRQEYYRRDYVLDGSPGYLVEGTGLDAKNIIVVTIKDDKEYSIVLRHFNNNPDKEMFMRVVESFKFI